MNRNIMTFAFIASFVITLLIPISNAENNSISFGPDIATTVPNGFAAPEGSSIMVLSSSGVESYGFLLFNLSSFPDGITPNIALLNIKTEDVPSSCYIDVFYTTDTSWVGANLTWGNLDSGGFFLSSVRVSSPYKLYSFTSNSFNRELIQACAQKGIIAICFKPGTENLGQYSYVNFAKDAKLDVYYNNNTSAPLSQGATVSKEPVSGSLSQSIINAITYGLLFVVAAIVIGVLVVISNRRKRQTGF